MRDEAHTSYVETTFRSRSQSGADGDWTPTLQDSRSRAPTAVHRSGRPSPRTRTSSRPTGSRLRAPTSASRDGRPPPLPRTSSRPTGIVRSRAPTSASLDLAVPRRFRARPLVPRAVVRARPLQHIWPPHATRAHVSRPTGSRSRAPTSAPRGGRPSPRTRTSSCPTGSRSRASTEAPGGGRPPRHARTCPHPTGSVLARPVSTSR